MIQILKLLRLEYIITEAFGMCKHLQTWEWFKKAFSVRHLYTIIYIIWYAHDSMSKYMYKKELIQSQQ